MAFGFEQIEEFWGRLDFIVANAGVDGGWAPLREIQTCEWEHSVDTNIKGMFLTVKLGLELLTESEGAVVIVSSADGNRAFSNWGATAYACSKAAQVAFSRMTARELAEFGIRVNAVCQGAANPLVDEPIKQLESEAPHLPANDGGTASPDQIADVIIFLLSEAASDVTGSEFYVGQRREPSARTS